MPEHRDNGVGKTRYIVFFKKYPALEYVDQEIDIKSYRLIFIWSSLIPRCDEKGLSVAVKDLV
jgi:hypothetical protein